MKKLIAIIGGIGAGKSVISRIVATLGYSVYDTDSRAKAIMDVSSEIHRQLVDNIHPLSVVDGVINRQLISSIVFNDSKSLEKLNSIVHHAVLEDLKKWVGTNTHIYNKEEIFVETAIPFSSNLIQLVDEVWQVSAPVDVRIERVIERSNLSAAQIMQRIESQKKEQISFDHNSQYYSITKFITNDGLTPLLPQIFSLL